MSDRSKVLLSRASARTRRYGTLELSCNAANETGRKGGCVHTTRLATVIVDVDDPRLGCFPLRNLVHVVLLRDASPDVEELPDPRVPYQVADNPAEQHPVRLRVGVYPVDSARPGRVGALGRVPVDLEVRRPAEQPVVHPRVPCRSPSRPCSRRGHARPLPSPGRLRQRPFHQDR